LTKKSKAVPVELPIYKIDGKYYFRDERLNEYRNICNPHDKKPLDSVLETPTAEDIKNVFGKCDKSPCNLKIKGEREELADKVLKEIEEKKRQKK